METVQHCRIVPKPSMAPNYHYMTFSKKNFSILLSSVRKRKLWLFSIIIFARLGSPSIWIHFRLRHFHSWRVQNVFDTTFLVWNDRTLLSRISSSFRESAYRQSSSLYQLCYWNSLHGTGKLEYGRGRFVFLRYRVNFRRYGTSVALTHHRHLIAYQSTLTALNSLILPSTRYYSQDSTL